MLAILVPQTAPGQESEERAEELLAQVLAEAEDEQVEPSVMLEDEYRAILAAWAAGSETAPAELSALQQESEYRDLRLIHAKKAAYRWVAPSSCWAQIQDNTFQSLARLEPESLLAVAVFHQLIWLGQTTPPLRLRLSEFSKATIFSLVDLYLKHAGKTDANRKNAALLLIALANTLRTQGYQIFAEEARDVFLQALKLDPDNRAARYGAACQEEKLGRYRRASRHLKRLSAAWPDDVEYRLRLALNLARTGELRAAADALESIARGDGPAEMRILAYQELASLHAQEHGALAIATLREAVDRFPQSWRLRLQLSNLLYRDWNEAVALAERVAGNWQEDPGISPRFRYESPRVDKRGYEHLHQEVDRLRPALARALERLARTPIAQRKSFPTCRGVMTR